MSIQIEFLVQAKTPGRTMNAVFMFLALNLMQIDCELCHLCIRDTRG